MEAHKIECDGVWGLAFGGRLNHESVGAPALFVGSLAIARRRHSRRTLRSTLQMSKFSLMNVDTQRVYSWIQKIIMPTPVPSRRLHDLARFETVRHITRGRYRTISRPGASTILWTPRTDTILCPGRGLYNAKARSSTSRTLKWTSLQDFSKYGQPGTRSKFPEQLVRNSKQFSTSLSDSEETCKTLHQNYKNIGSRV